MYTHTCWKSKHFFQIIFKACRVLKYWASCRTTNKKQNHFMAKNSAWRPCCTYCLTNAIILSSSFLTLSIFCQLKFNLRSLEQFLWWAISTMEYADFLCWLYALIRCGSLNEQVKMALWGKLLNCRMGNIVKKKPFLYLCSHLHSA